MKKLLFFSLTIALILCSFSNLSAKSPISNSLPFISVSKIIKYYNFTGSSKADVTKSIRTKNIKKEVLQSSAVSILPNSELSGSIQIKLTVQNEGLATVTVFDEAGKSISQHSITLVAGANIVAVDNIATLTSGNYNVVIEGATVKAESKLLIW